MTAFRAELLSLAKYVRDSLREVGDLDSFKLEIEIEGRVHEGDIRINLALKHPYKYGFDISTASDLDALLEEFKRRFGWVKRNAPLCLPSAPQIEALPETLPTAANEDIPF